MSSECGKGGERKAETGRWIGKELRACGLNPLTGEKEFWGEGHLLLCRCMALCRCCGPGRGHVELRQILIPLCVRSGARTSLGKAVDYREPAVSGKDPRLLVKITDNFFSSVNSVMEHSI